MPESLGNLVNLRRLDLHGNNLGELPESVGNLVRLAELDRSDNVLSEMPDLVCELDDEDG
jgi:Leucine-rich repeat (LRR) protein